jgi:2-octaprenyl-6-methoxyphenol hydroxylase
METQTHHVLIVGGGPVGLSLALALSQAVSGLAIGILDRRVLKVPEDRRATAIAAGVRRVFEALDVWDVMRAEAQPIERMKITDSGGDDLARPLFLDFSGSVGPGEPFAHMVPNGVLHGALLKKLGDTVEQITPVSVTGSTVSGRLRRLTLDDGRTLSAPLVVAADGALSPLRGMAGIGTLGHDYAQSGIVATIGHEVPHEGVAYEHFRPAGPFASLPLRGNRSSLVWTETREKAEGIRGMAQDDLALLIEQAMGSTLGAVTLEDRPQVFPLRLQIARNLIAERLALIGDAAHVIHPIAGQGLNLGLKDVAALSEAVVDSMRLGLDWGDEAVLRRFQAWRRLDTSLMAMATDGLNRLFSNDVAPVRIIRDIGLGLVDRMPQLKSALITQASGLEGGGPKLLAGRAL